MIKIFLYINNVLYCYVLVGKPLSLEIKLLNILVQYAAGDKNLNCSIIEA